jgi:cytochrome P450
MFAIPNTNYIGLMSELDPKKQGAMRMNISSAYTMTNMLKAETYVDDMIHLMEKRVLQASRSGQPIAFGDWIHFLTWDIMGEITFSKRFGFLDEARDVGNVIKNTFYLGFYVTLMAYMQWLHSLLFGNPILRWLDIQPNEHAYVTCVNSIAERKTRQETHVDMMEYWLRAQEKDPERMTDKDVFAAVMGNLGGGGDTIGSVLQAFFYLLLKGSPVHLQRVREEIDAANAAGQLSSIVTYAEATQLPYLQACVSLIFHVPAQTY